MAQYFALDYTGAPFQLFGVPHLTYLGITLAACVFMFFWKPDEATRRRYRISMAVLMVLVESSWHIWNIVVGNWSVDYMLPLHLCSFLVWTIPVLLITRR